MLENLTDRIKQIARSLSGRGRLKKSDIEKGMRDIRRALIEADVNLQVARDFTKGVEEEAINQKVYESFTPAEMLLKIVGEKLIELIGKVEPLKLDYQPASILLVGLQGSGKTTTAIKLAVHLKKQGRKPYLIPADVKRPAAFEQLRDLAEREELPYFGTRLDNEVKLCKQALTQSVLRRYDTLIFDTAGRLHIDTEMINQVKKIKNTVNPSEVLLIADGMTGQDAVNIAGEFDKQVGITGIILTKMDGDARGGAALSMRAVTGKPIKFLGIGEKPSDLQLLHPERLASRILGMGDIRTLQEKAEKSIEEEKAKEFQKKLKEAKLDLDDFLHQIKSIKNMGPIEDLLDMIPGGKDLKKLMDEKQLIRTEAIIQSMTLDERRNPKVLNASRKRRIAGGSGTSVQEINQLMKEYEMVKKMMKQMKGRSPSGPVLSGQGPLGRGPMMPPSFFG
ncbi:signal recognition particle protein [candidate division WOR-3 bacterium]|nr:signal recognition particle protein [candidate division WOR-3 bacterium]